jgi:hypothetical protein
MNPPGKAEATIELSAGMPLIVADRLKSYRQLQPSGIKVTDARYLSGTSHMG